MNKYFSVIIDIWFQPLIFLVGIRHTWRDSTFTHGGKICHHIQLQFTPNQVCFFIGLSWTKWWEYSSTKQCSWHHGCKLHGWFLQPDSFLGKVDINLAVLWISNTKTWPKSLLLSLAPYSYTATVCFLGRFSWTKTSRKHPSSNLSRKLHKTKYENQKHRIKPRHHQCHMLFRLKTLWTEDLRPTPERFGQG